MTNLTDAFSLIVIPNYISGFFIINSSVKFHDLAYRLSRAAIEFFENMFTVGTVPVRANYDNRSIPKILNRVGKTNIFVI